MTLERRKPIRKMSKARAEAATPTRAAVVRRVATSKKFCPWPDCRRLGTQPHEIWTRARASDIEHCLTCPDNIVMMCDEHYEFPHLYEDIAKPLGLIRNSWDGCPCGFPTLPAPPNVIGRIERIED
jgi:hypothetical protein